MVSSTPKPDELFVSACDVPHGWQADLDRLNPAGECLTKLRLHWYAGIEYQPVQRWAVWEIIPAALWARILDDEAHAGISRDESMTWYLLEDLRGPDPRTWGEWVPCHCGPHMPCRHPRARKWVSQSAVSRAQWELYRETEGIPRLTWVIQGDRGGHAWQWGPIEYAWLLSTGITAHQAHQLMDAVPDPGSLPYAPYDQRVYHALAQRDKLRDWRQSLSWIARTGRSRAGLVMQGDQRHHRMEFNRLMLRFLENQIADAVSDIPRRLLPHWSDMPTTDTVPDHERVDRALIEGI